MALCAVSSRFPILTTAPGVLTSPFLFSLFSVLNLVLGRDAEGADESGD